MRLIDFNIKCKEYRKTQINCTLWSEIPNILKDITGAYYFIIIVYLNLYNELKQIFILSCFFKIHSYLQTGTDIYWKFLYLIQQKKFSTLN